MRAGVLMWLCLVLLPGLARAQQDGGVTPAPTPSEAPDAAPAKPSGPLEVLVLGGGKTPEEAEAWMKRWRSAEPVLRQLVVFAEGYPRVLQSATVEGLKPGFHIVVLGFCGAAEREVPHKLIKSFFPGTYAKAVKGQEAACPESLGDDVSIAFEHTVRKDDLRLVAVQVDAKEDSSAHVVLFQDDTVLEHKSETYGTNEEPWPVTCSVSHKGTKSRVTAEVECTAEAIGCANNTTYSLTRMSYAIDQGKLATNSVLVEERTSGYCD
jgi:hypothetical protein